MTWTQHELTVIDDTDELEIAPRRADGSLRDAVPIWVVRDGEDLYGRSWRGQAGRPVEQRRCRGVPIGFLALEEGTAVSRCG